MKNWKWRKTSPWQSEWQVPMKRYDKLERKKIKEEKALGKEAGQQAKFDIMGGYPLGEYHTYSMLQGLICVVCDYLWIKDCQRCNKQLKYNYFLC